MAQTDITTFFSIVFWSFIVIIFSFIFFYIFFMPVFLFKTKVILKLKNITFLKIIFFADQLRVLEAFSFFFKFKKVLKNIKNI